MFQTTFNSQIVFLVDDVWNGSEPLQADFSLHRDTQASLTKREGRRPYSATLRVSLKYTATVHGAALRQLQGTLRALSTQPVIAPFWPAISRWQDRASVSISGGLKIVWNADWSQFEIFTSVEPSWPSPDDNIAPALYGFIAPTEPTMLNPNAAQWEVDFTESSPADYALAPGPFAPPAGPQPAGYSFAPPLLPFQPDFHAISEDVRVEVKRDSMGFTRQQSQTFYPHPATRSQKASYTFGGGTAMQLLRFFQDVAGPGASFWVPGWFEIARLTQDVQAADAVLDVEGSGGVNVGDYVCLFDISNFVARKVTAKTANTITLDSAAGVSTSAGTTLVLPLCLARLEKPTLRLSWKTPGIATCELPWIEVPAEYVPAADETIGATLGKLSTRVILFHFTRDLGNGSVLNYYFTNFEKDLSWNGQTWISQNIECGDITQSLNLEDDGVDLTTYKFSGNPLIEDVTRRAEAPLSVVIQFADFDGTTVTSPTIVFSGDASAPSRQGNRIKVNCRFGPGVLDTQLPFFIRGMICNHVRGSNADGAFLISAGCTLLRNDWKFTGLVAAPVSSAFPYTVHLTNLARVSGPAPIYFANWFAAGVIEWGGGASVQRRFITGSTNPVGGVLSVTIHRYFNGVPNIGDTITLTPACDGIHTTCKAYNAATNPTGKFNNFLNFGGEPFTPTGNPSFVGQPNVGVQGGKK